MAIETHSDAPTSEPTRIDIRTIDSDCMRCGYLLVGVADDQPCPECGLLAGRSRRLTDALWDARPGWLRKLSIGLWLVLLSVPLMNAALPIAGYLVQLSFKWRNPAQWREVLVHGPFLFVCCVFAIGLHLLTVKEGYAPADIGDRWRRRAIRFLSMLPILGVLSISSTESPYWTEVGIHSEDFGKLVGTMIIVAALLALPVLGFTQLRSLARRVRHAHLAEHCHIVGWGMSAVVVLATVCFFIAARSGHTTWAHQSQSFVWMILVGMGGLVLFLLWAIYIWIGFAIVFRRARLEMQRRIRAADRNFEAT